MPTSAARSWVPAASTSKLFPLVSSCEYIESPHYSDVVASWRFDVENAPGVCRDIPIVVQEKVCCDGNTVFPNTEARHEEKIEIVMEIILCIVRSKMDVSAVNIGVHWSS